MKTFKITSASGRPCYASAEGVDWLFFGNKIFKPNRTKEMQRFDKKFDSLKIGESFEWKGRTVERIEFISEDDLRDNRKSESDYFYYDSSKGGFW